MLKLKIKAQSKGFKPFRLASVINHYTVEKECDLSGYKNSKILLNKFRNSKNEKNILLIAALVIVFANVVVACPPGMFESDYHTTTFNGCTIGYTFCYGEYGNYDAISLGEIIIYPPCSSDVYEDYKKEIIDQILLEIPVSQELITYYGSPDYIPICPNGTMCFLRVYDALCYSGWYKDFDIKYIDPPPPDGFVWRMQVCDDDQLRTCYSTIYYCWEIVGNQQVLRMEKYGTKLGPECPKDCEWSCEEE